jgi:hypothetical protein
VKHTHKETLTILAWTVFSMVFGMFIYNIVPQQELEGFSQVELLFAIIFLIGVAAVFWYMILRLKKNVAMVYSFGIGMLFSGIVDSTLHLQGTTGTIVRISVFFGMWIFYYQLVKFMKRSAWKDIQWKIQVNNLITLLAMVFVSVQIGKSLKPSIALILFVVVSIYDALAVWKLGTMQQMAMQFLDNLIIPGVAYAKRKKKKFAILGGGDIFFLILVPTAMANYSISLAITMMLSMFSAIVLLFYASSKNKFYPALPFMLAGALVGLVVWGGAMWWL